MVGSHQISLKSFGIANHPKHASILIQMSLKSHWRAVVCAVVPRLFNECSMYCIEKLENKLHFQGIQRISKHGLVKWTMTKGLQVHHLKVCSEIFKTLLNVEYASNGAITLTWRIWSDFWDMCQEISTLNDNWQHQRRLGLSKATVFTSNVFAKITNQILHQ